MRTFPSDKDWATSGYSWGQFGLDLLTGGMYSTVKAGALAYHMINDYLHPTTSNADTTETDKIPNAKGSKNQPLANTVYPVCIGKTLFTPRYFAPYTIPSGVDGQDQKYYCAFLLGYNKLRLSKIKMGAIDLVINNQVDNGIINVNTDYNEDYTKNIHLYLEQNEPNDETVRNQPIPISIGGVTDDKLVATYKVNQQDFGIELLKPEGQDALNVTKFSNYNPMKIEVEIFFNSLFQYNDKGEINERSVKVKVELSYDGGNTWFPIGFPNQSSSDTGSKCKVSYADGITTFTAKKNKNMRFVATHTFSYSDCFDSNGNRKLTNRVVEVRVRRWSDQSTDTKVNDKVYLSAIRTYSYDETKSKANSFLVPEKIQDDIRFANSSRLSMCIDLKDGDTLENFNVDEISTIIEPYCRTWNGEEWSTTYSPSSNPASVSLMLMQHNMLGKEALVGEREKKIDLLKYGELYERCENHKSYKTINGVRQVVNTPLRCGNVITNKGKLADIINSILDTARSTLVMNGTKYSVNIDCPKNTPVHILNNHNILADKRSNSKEFKKPIDGLKITFRNELNDYAQDELKVFYDGVSESDDNILESVTLNNITNPDLVWSYGRYLLAKYVLRPEVWELKLGIDGKIIEIGSLVEIQDDTISVGIGDGGFITKLNTTATSITGFEIDSEIYLENDKEYGVKILHSNGFDEPVVKVCKLKTSNIEAGYYSSFELEESVGLQDLSLDDNCSFGLYEQETIQALCVNKTDNGNCNYSFVFVPYDEGVYTADQQDIPEFDSKITNVPQNVGKSEPVKDYVESKDVNKFIESAIGENEKPATPINVQALFDKDGIKLSCELISTVLKDSIQSYEWEVQKSADNIVKFEVTTPSSHFNFDREVDGYPEVDTIRNWKVRVRARNIFNNYSDWTELLTVNSLDYKTWIIPKPSQDTVSVEVIDRTATIKMTTPSHIEVYGDIRYKLSIKRVGTDRTGEGYPEVTPDVNWYKPNLYSNPLTDEQAYKSESETDYEVSSGRFSQTLPLAGQNTNNIANTLYSYKIVAFNESGFGTEPFEVVVTALCTSIRDIVKAHEDYKDLYVTRLSALNANVGLISQGGFGNFAKYKNFWALTNMLKEDTGLDEIVKEGAFRVGDDKQFIAVIPPHSKFSENDETLVNNSDDVKIVIRAGNITLSTDSSSFGSGTYIIDKDPTKRMLLTSSGIIIQQLVNGEWENRANLGADIYGNLTITNADDNDTSLPKLAIGVDDSNIIYHLENNTKDTEGGNGADLQFDENGVFLGGSVVTSHPTCFKGKIIKELEEGDICLFNSGDYLKIGNDVIDVKSGEVNGELNYLNNLLGNHFVWE